MEMWHKRQAADIFSQLPDNLEDQLKIMEFVQKLIEFAQRGKNVVEVVVGA